MWRDRITERVLQQAESLKALRSTTGAEFFEQTAIYSQACLFNPAMPYFINTP
jgi:hypothetical protein